MEQAAILEDQLSGAKVPPEVWVGDAASGHAEQAKREDGHEYPAGLQEAEHDLKATTTSAAAQCTVSQMNQNRSTQSSVVIKVDWFRKPAYLLPIIFLVGFAAWRYGNQVWKGHPGDIYQRWLGSRELLLNGRNPYGEEVTEEIQIGLNGHKYDSRRDTVE